MSIYSIPHGLTSNSSYSTCPKIPYHWEMQQLCGALEYFMTVSKVPDTEDTIKFMLDTEEFTYTIDMFRVTLHLPVETLENPFVAPVNIQTIKAFTNMVGYQGVVDKKYLNIPQRIDEDYHSIKDDILLVSVYTIGNVLVRGMLISDEFLTKEICATNDFKKYETVFIGVDVLMNQLQPVVSTQGTYRSTPRAHMTPSVSTAKKLDEEEIEKIVEGEGDAKSYASEFANSMINDDVDDSGTKIEPGSHKEHPKNVTDDDEEIKKEKKDEGIEKEKKDKEIEKEKNIDDVEKTNEVVKEKYIDVATGMIREVLDHCNKVVPEMTFTKTNEMIKEEMPQLVNIAVNKDREVSPANVSEFISKEFATHGPIMIEKLFRKHMQNTTLNLYPTTSSSTAEKSSADLQHQLYLNRKSKSQDQAADLEILEILKTKCASQDVQASRIYIRDMERKCVTTSEFWKVRKKVDQVLHEIVPQVAERATEDLIENNLKPCID
ncbi:hypothetical protein Tco_0970316 [Tanacetum coccineum]